MKMHVNNVQNETRVPTLGFIRAFLFERALFHFIRDRSRAMFSFGTKVAGLLFRFNCCSRFGHPTLSNRSCGNAIRKFEPLKCGFVCDMGIVTSDILQFLSKIASNHKNIDFVILYKLVIESCINDVYKLFVFYITL